MTSGEMTMMEGVMRERERFVGVKLSMFMHLSEAQAALFMNRNFSTLRRDRRAGKIKPGIHYIDLGERGIRFGVWQLCKWWLGIKGPEDDPSGGGSCPNTPSGSPAGNGGSVSEKVSTTDAGSTSQPDKQTVSALAQKTFQRQKNV